MSRGNTFYDAQCPEFVQGNAPDASHSKVEIPLRVLVTWLSSMVSSWLKVQIFLSAVTRSSWFSLGNSWRPSLRLLFLPC